MVSNLKIIFMCITLILSLGFPVLLAVVVVKKHSVVLKSILIGALVFFIFQIVLRIPMLQILSKQSYFVEFSKHYLMYSIFLGLTAGIFKEVGRYIGFKGFLKDRLNYKNGLAYGVGHGGIESILIVGLSYINNIVYAFLINFGILDVLLKGKVSPDMIRAIKSALVETPASAFLLAGFERVFTMAIQIALSLLVLVALKKGKLFYLVLAILLHTIIDAPAAYMSLLKVNMFAIELVVLLWAVLSLVYIMRWKDIYKMQES
ncbi:YhfC family intramembrane metalloprotease [Caldicellulosiruptor morganii]|uniref:YhfC family intramembrane metalloprotease n=1 Tax=Caldicellulosiruptor morganii TaxID=1387555 RepID=A0ABY7BMK1_9FIRM|nr:YhfC family glutamic-type intramembrane protease [Caldicellulosiruptor morganii]WAM34045.1 YhfC family intramembrane metalloprotease [Caldicellulosiruptor morganii]